MTRNKARTVVILSFLYHNVSLSYSGTSSEGRETLSMNLSATLISAASGQGKNQSIVVQLMRDGKFRHLTRRASPTGDMQSTTWRFSRTRVTKVVRQDSRASDIPSSLHTVIMSPAILSCFVRSGGGGRAKEKKRFNRAESTFLSPKYLHTVVVLAY